MDIEYSIPKDNPVWLVRDGVERMNLGKLFSTYSHLERNEVDPRQMLEEIPDFFLKLKRPSGSASVMEMNCISGILRSYCANFLR